MSFRSIIDVDVNEEKFKEFLAKFEKFHSAAKEIPEPFHKMDKKIEVAKKGFGKLGNSLKKSMAEGATATKGFSLELHHAGKHFATLSTRIGHSNKELNAMGETGRKTFGIIARGATSVFKAIPLIGGAIAGAGLAAVALYQHQSNTIMNRYKNSKYLGMTPGQVSAVDTQFQGVLANPATSLAQMRHAEFSPASFSYFARAIGKNWRHMSTRQMFDAELRHAKRVADKTPRRLLSIEDRTHFFKETGLDTFDLEELKKTKWATLNADMANANRRAAALNFSKQTGRSMTSLSIAISQKEVELSTDLSRIMAKGAPLMHAALNKIVNSLNWAANRINASLSGMISGKAPTKGQGMIVNTAGKVYNALHDAHSAQGNLAFAKARMEQAAGTSRYPAAKAYYEREKAEYAPRVSQPQTKPPAQPPAQHQRTDHQLYHVIKRAVVDGMRESGTGTPAHNMGAQIHMAAQ